MARPREFDPDDAIERAMQVFWEHGYAEASLPDLLNGMGLTRGSLYKAFKDKKNLFLLVLNRYELEAVDTGVAKLKQPAPPDGKDRILRMFQSLVDTVSAGDYRGCLLCTAASGSASRDPDIAEAVQVGLVKLQEGLAAALADAESLKALSDAEVRQLADTLLTQYIGLRMLTRSQLPLGILDQAVAAVEGIIDGAGDRSAG